MIDWTAIDVEPGDWKFPGLDLRDEAVVDCFIYEFARETSWVREFVADCRDYYNWQHPSEFGNHRKLVEAWHDDNAPRHTGKWLACRISGGYLGCPNWPDRGFLSLRPKERKEIVAEGDSRKAPSFKPMERVIRDWLFASDSPITEDEACQAVGPRGTIPTWSSTDGPSRGEIVAFAVDWLRTNDDLTDSFREWLRDNRPNEFRPTGSRGNKSRLRQLRSALTALGAHRFWHASGGSFKDVRRDHRRQGSPLGNNFDRASGWSDAKRLVRVILQAFEDRHPPSTSSPKHRPPDFLKDLFG